MNRTLTALIAGASILGLSGAAIASDMNKSKSQASENRNTNPTGKKTAPKATPNKSGATKTLPKAAKDQAGENRNTNPTGTDKGTMRMQQNKSGAAKAKDPNPKQVDENRNTDPTGKKKN